MRPEAPQSILGAAGDNPVRSYAIRDDPPQSRLGHLRERATGDRAGGFRWRMKTGVRESDYRDTLRNVREWPTGAAGGIPVLSCHHPRQWRLGRVWARATGATRGEGSRWQDEPESRSPEFRSAADSPSGTMAIRFRGRRRSEGDPGLRPARVSDPGGVRADVRGCERFAFYPRKTGG